jgi:hypothetical protein
VSFFTWFFNHQSTGFENHFQQGYQKLSFSRSLNHCRCSQFFLRMLYYLSCNLNLFMIPTLLDKRFGCHRTDYQYFSPKGKLCFVLLLKSFQVSFYPTLLEFLELLPRYYLCYENVNDSFLNHLITQMATLD